MADVMTSEPKRNLRASVRQRLLTLSQHRKEPFDLVLVRYGIERLLFRLSKVEGLRPSTPPRVI